ncbi:oxidoreductase [Mucilaginibacter terrenus]|uniref:Oxidoreductase n=1 Tax=Mucilaginibacter terrenus TaxID=2482727 RepID=A0A3E2NXY5_9SPHI|nr:YCF48-related protein [Mucilaginibacter terrenus]RFZ85720.1 oxidoreductase [Mucilaginibacter terrenus]
MKIAFKLFALVALLFPTFVNAQTITRMNQPASASIRGLSVVDNNVAWVSGSRGNFAISTDGGKTWAWNQVKGYEKSDFRDIEAFSSKEAIVMSSGSPAVILKTTDGGTTWQEKYRQTEERYFLDAMDFADEQHGFILGDPINGKFLLLETKDGGSTWAQANGPEALKDEAAFAASGTCIRAAPMLTVVTGGSHSRILIANPNNLKWTATMLPLTNGTPSRGAFSFATGSNSTIVVGGNYAKDVVADSVAYVFKGIKKLSNGGNPQAGPAGFQSSVEFLKGQTFLATGTSGSNISTDGGKNWRKIDDKSYNVCRKAKHGNLVLLAGDGAKIGIYNP